MTGPLPCTASPSGWRGIFEVANGAVRSPLRAGADPESPRESGLQPKGWPENGGTPWVHCGKLSIPQQFRLWETDSLRTLFRDNKQPPVPSDYPSAWNESLLGQDDGLG
jgi:hypothetical protein